ncbi:MAG: hypothetical protein ACQESC_03960 [Nanobdellota archaeon]
MIEWLVPLLIVFLVFLISALPLHFSAKLLGGQTSILKSIIINVLAGIVASLTATFVPFFATIPVIIALLVLYKFAFGVGWLKALIIWFVQILFTGLLVTLAVALGIAGIASFTAFSL